ncbi:TlpA family protein disulfide reductase [Bacillus siamensis]|uniref:TlpA family protein disulfide reductase n=1 Tax=Bacillus siamensis TaxID=659243 RepID=UPI0007EAA86A|nr:redoxin domain-containing protein [Bacillus siamensis]OAZ59853.1 Thiol-disulfide oxidoreductase ResA [Bacillus siamensis]UZD75882.1 redoxin domain-containing protein [Bacillus siamensis]
MLAKWLGVLLLIGLLVYAGWNIYSAQTSPKEGTEEGMKAPDFTLDTLSGKSSSLSDYKGKKVLLNFWATWCKPCRMEMPDMQELQKEYPDIAVVAVNFTSSEKNIQAVKSFADTYQLTFPILIDKSGINGDFNVLSYPTSYILDEKGTIQHIRVGTMTKKEMKEKLDLK